MDSGSIYRRRPGPRPIPSRKRGPPRQHVECIECAQECIDPHSGERFFCFAHPSPSLCDRLEPLPPHGNLDHAGFQCGKDSLRPTPIGEQPPMAKIASQNWILGSSHSASGRESPNPPAGPEILAFKSLFRIYAPPWGCPYRPAHGPEGRPPPSRCSSIEVLLPLNPKL